MRTTVILAIIISALSISCSTKTQNSDNPSVSKAQGIQQSENKIPDSLKVQLKSTDLYIVTDVTEADFTRAQKEYKTGLIADTLKYPKKNNCLKLPISNGLTTEISFCDSLLDADENPEGRHYSYKGHFSTINYYLVECVFYENYTCDIINMKTGKSITISGIPQLSPNSKYIAEIIAIGGYGDVPIGFEICKFNEKTKSFFMTKGIEQKVDDVNWYPLDFVWTSDNSLIIKIISTKSNDYKNYKLKTTKDAVYKKIDLR